MSRATTLWLRGEALVILAAAVFLLWQGYDRLGVFPPWAVVLILLAPDLSMLGYAAGPKPGAICYNAAHTYAAPILALAMGWQLLGEGARTAAAALALFWIIHIAADRLLGYGLKAPTGFRDTHLGRLGGGGDG
ncbi:MAG: DUF4260 domain-containing protein [Tabrizicola sp.]|nr:DUF4260 domain-containing protein [Tabrizicola sp.]